MTRRPVRLLGAALGALSLAACVPGVSLSRPGPSPEQAPSILPAPQSVRARDGSFLFDRATAIVLPASATAEMEAVAQRWAADMRRGTGLPLPVTREGSGPPDPHPVRLRIDPAASPSAEGYSLSVTPGGVTVAARQPAGLFYGLQTLRQLLPPDAESGRAGSGAWRAAAVEIRDAPRFPYRGLHLDVGRHFMPVDFVKKYLDLMALYKLNTFHWHLTDDQGWRIEIQRYPLLTEVGGCRRETVVAKNTNPYVGDGTPYCGYYTQDEVREIVRYAQARFITVIPEIEMPGHAGAALAAYPNLACTPGPFEVVTRWGVYENIFCPKEETFTFLEGVLTEVMELFPGTYIHIGGDEAPKTAWEKSDVAQAVIRREGLKDEHELQSYFIRRMERFLNSRGRQIIGWDEILEGGLAPNATVMSWRGVQGGIEAARQGHDVVMTPTSDLYLDYYQGDPAQEPLAIGGFLPLERVYAYEPIPPELTAEEARHVLGAQGNVWTEYLSTPAMVEYMAFPRVLALAELDWSPKEARDWDDFVRRLPAQLARLDALGVGYRVPDVVGLGRDRLTTGETMRVELASPFPGARIHYTLDGSEPTAASPEYDEPFHLRVNAAGTRVLARAVRADGRSSAVASARFARTAWLPAEEVDAPLSRGLALDFFPGAYRTVAELQPLTPARTESAAMLPTTVSGPRTGVRLSGYLHVPADGMYTFLLTSRDGSRLSIGGRTVVDHDGPHGISAKEGQVALRRGYHPVEAWFARVEPAQGFRVEVETEEGARSIIPAEWLAHLPRP